VELENGFNAKPQLEALWWLLFEKRDIGNNDFLQKRRHLTAERVWDTAVDEVHWG